jgi:hypothetical protein
MLPELFDFFGDVTPVGALALLVIGFLLGTALHEYTVWLIMTMRTWYAGLHD